ncbi:MAG: hypothetical protein IKI75_12015 [Lachnospiraceae bacterium]|nr:hypothetical protein [Lachnospiraceae bacterium]
MNEFMNGMLGKIAPGMCRLSMSGGIAIKTSGGYKSYDIKIGRLTNCNSFVFDIGEDFFFVIPTNKVKPGDIILANGKPKCVISAGKDTISALNYEDSTVEQIMPERHIFMGSTYFYGKIVSMLGSRLKKGKGPGKIMKYMCLSQMMKGGGGEKNSLLPLLMLGGGGNGLFEGVFDDDILGEDDDDDENDDDIV